MCGSRCPRNLATFAFWRNRSGRKTWKCYCRSTIDMGIFANLIAACQKIPEILTVLVGDKPQIIWQSVGLNQLTNHPLGDSNGLSQILNCLEIALRRCFGILGFVATE